MQLNKMEKNKIKLLSLTNYVLEYRIPVYNLLAETFELTVAHFGEEVSEDKANFRQIILSPKNLGPFIFFKENIAKLASNYDAVLALGELRLLPYMKLGFLFNRKFSLTYWNIGVSASYRKKFDEDRRLDFIRFRLLNKADSIVFYTDYPVKRYVEDGGVAKEKLFVANNTVEVLERIPIKIKKKHFLFVGTLYKAKKIFDLLEAYLLAYNNDASIKPLVIIGDGEEKANIENWIILHALKEKITLTGAVFNQQVLKSYYQDAVALISPGQAGLTVLNSFAYGVPFVTSENAITGGEVFNITNGVNGIIFKESLSRLSEILAELSNDDLVVNNMSINAQNYYFNERTIDVMVNGLKDSLSYAHSKIK